MKCKFLLSIVLPSVCLLIVSLTVNADSNTKFNYNLKSKIGLDFSNFYRGPLKLEKFADKRSGLSGKQINESENLPLSADAIIHNAIAQGFAQGKGKLVNENYAQVLSGEITDFHSETIEKDGASHIQVSVRASFKLSSSGKQLWQGVAFGRSAVAAEKGLNTALQEALDKFVVSVFIDDYFILQLID